MLSDNWSAGEKKCSNPRALGSLHCPMDAGKLIVIIILWEYDKLNKFQESSGSGLRNEMEWVEG